MKNFTRNFSGLFTIAIFIFSVVSTVHSQCLNQVTDTSGTSIVAGTSITVTSFGFANTNTGYCTATTPYNLGYLIGSGITANSGYTFQFTPPVDSVTLNFSGLSNTPPYQEIVMVEINGVRYAIPSAGILNGCDALADLTPQGYITGCMGCGVSGWSGTTIAGPVSLLTVIDSAALNGQGGNQSLFSLFICSSNTGMAEEASANAVHVYPNPTSDELSISVNNDELSSVTLYDVSSRKIFYRSFTRITTLNTEQLAKGIYIYELSNKNGVIRNGKIMKN